MQSNEKARNVVGEIHPEICFWGLNGLVPMARGKKEKKQIYKERLTMLRGCWPRAEYAAQAIRARFSKDVLVGDDILDVVVAALTARAKKLSRLPRDPERDSTGLPMQMVWTVPQNIVWR